MVISVCQPKTTIGLTMRQWKRLLARYWGRVLALMLPDHAKRILFILTLYRYVKGEAPDNETLSDLNERLHLATTDVRALVIPSMLQARVWRGDGSSFSEWSDDVLSIRLITRCPCWLRYGRDDDILRDVTTLRSYLLQTA